MSGIPSSSRAGVAPRDWATSTSQGWYLVSAPIITADWEAESGNRWTIPIGMDVGKVLRLGKLPFNCTAQGYYNLDKPVSGGDWALRRQVQLLLPKTMFSGGT